MGRTALELIGQGGLGYSFDRLVEESEDEFGDAMKGLMYVLPLSRPFSPYNTHSWSLRRPNLFITNTFRNFINFAVKIGSPQLRRVLIDISQIRALRALKNISDTLNTRSEEIFRMKKTMLESGDENAVHQVGEGKDIMSILC